MAGEYDDRRSGRSHDLGGDDDHERAYRPRVAPGKLSRTAAVYGRIYRDSDTAAPVEADPGLIDAAARTSGQALPDELRGELEQSIGADLSAVRVHTDAASADAAQSINAKAYTTGSDIFFAPGSYDPDSDDGRRLIAHEVAHTAQQAAAPAVQAKLEVSQPGDSLELEADRFADAFVAGHSAPVTSASSGAGIARAPMRGTPKRDAKPQRADLANRLREILRRSIPREPGRARDRAIEGRRTELVAWVEGLSEEDARIVLSLIQPGGDLRADFERQISTTLRREVWAKLGSIVPTGAMGMDGGEIAQRVPGIGDDSTIVDQTTTEREDQYVPSGRLAVEVSPTRFRLWGFDVDSAEPKAEFNKALDQIAQMLMVDPQAFVYISGFASSTGAEAHNEGLAEERAIRIMEALEERGIDRMRTFIRGHGESRPLLKERENPAAMARNRRVELEVQLVTGGPTITAPPPEPDKPPMRLPCKAARFYVGLYTALRISWDMTGGGASYRDPGGDVLGALPDRTYFYMEMRRHVSSEHAVLAYENLTGLNHPPPPSSAERAEWDRNVTFYTELQNSGACDPNGEFTPGAFMRRRDRPQWPQPNGTAAGGQRF